MSYEPRLTVTEEARDQSVEGDKRIKLWPTDRPSATVHALIVRANKHLGYGWPLVGRALVAHLLWATLPIAIVLAQGQWHAALSTTIALVLLSREVRALENLVHWFSHNGFDDSGETLGAMSNITLNDAVANGMAAIAVGQRVETFRETHIPEHHRKTFGKSDPCRSRMQGRSDVQDGRLPGLWLTLARAPVDAFDFYRTVGSRPTMIGGWLAWQAVAVALPLVVAFGFVKGLTAYGLILAAAQTLLIALRAVAEAGEHDYSPGNDNAVLSRTFDNLGFGGWLCHPAWDGYHFGHHAAMAAQPWTLKALTRQMLKADPAVGALVRVRRLFLETPKPYFGTLAANQNIDPPPGVNDNGPDGLPKENDK